MLNRDHAIIGLVGVVLWAACGIAATIVARIIPVLRQTQWLSDLLLSFFAAILGGLAATALDFGGWNEPDWRAGLFSFACALAVTGWTRVIKLRTS